MNNIANDLFDFIWNPISEKLLICKDDPTIDLGKLKILNSCKIFKEITCNTNPSPDSPISLYDMIHINIGTAYCIKENSDIVERHRIFIVDQVNSLVALQDYFVGILQFTQASFENMMLCNSLFVNLYGLEVETIEVLTCFDVDVIQAERDMDSFLQPLQNTILQNINHHLINKW